MLCISFRTFAGRILPVSTNRLVLIGLAEFWGSETHARLFRSDTDTRVSDWIKKGISKFDPPNCQYETTPLHLERLTMHINQINGKKTKCCKTFQFICQIPEVHIRRTALLSAAADGSGSIAKWSRTRHFHADV